VLHIATVHHGSPRWIEIQVRHLRAHIPVTYQTWTSLQGIDPSYGRFFDHVIEQRGSHAGKLNHLAGEILHTAADDDLVMFLDGDAFPIANPIPLIERSLAGAPLLAVRREENAGDPQPHPCFCVTSVGAWRQLAGDWSPGFTWVNDAGERVTDVGGNLLRRLQLTGTPWVEVLRTNRSGPDPIFFGIYGGVVYHHGAGFRGAERLNRLHFALAPDSVAGSGAAGRGGALGLWRRLRRRRWQAGTKRRLVRLSERIHAQIERGDRSWLGEIGSGDVPQPTSSSQSPRSERISS
jgi:hypothetical protein